MQPILHIKRDDLIHPVVQGNKWRKLHLLLQRLQDERVRGVLSFGGAYSNSLHALALAGPLFQLKTAAILRGTQADPTNPTLSDVLANGMEIFPVPKVEYDKKGDSEVVKAIIAQFPGYYVLPEGGATLEGIQGCMAIAEEILADFQVPHHQLFIAVPAGTGCTAAGILAGLEGRAQVLVFPAAAYGVNALTIQEMLVGNGFPDYKNFQFFPEYVLGKFAAPDKKILAFAHDFETQNGIRLDPFYTSRMLYGVRDLGEKGFFKAGDVVVAVHTGGLQAWRGITPCIPLVSPPRVS